MPDFTDSADHVRYPISRDDVPHPISWGEWCELGERLAKLERNVATWVVALEGLIAKQEDLLHPTNGALVLRTQELAPITPRRQIRATRLPEDWVPHDSTIAKMSDELRVNGEALHRAHLKFVDHFLSAPGQKGVKVDWDRTWCNWMRTESERGSLRVGVSNGSTVADKAQGWMELGNSAGSN